MLALALYVLLALGFSFFCSIAEAVLLSVTPSYMAQLAQEGDPAGPLLRGLKENIDRPLAAILTLNTLAHTLGAAGAGAQAAIVFGSRWVGVISLVLTLLILFLSEIIPKTIGAVYWRPLAPFIARAVRVLIRLLYPFVIVSEKITRMLGPERRGGEVSREEFAALAEYSREAGTLRQEESVFFRNLLRFETLRIEDVMTPRTVMFALPAAMNVGEFWDQHPEVPFSRLPVFGRDLDDITGYVLKTDLLLAHARGEDSLPLDALRRDLPAVPAIAVLSKVFDTFARQCEHIVLAVDEYGGTAGIATLEDLFETLLGLEIIDEADETADMRVLARRQWERRARLLGLVPTADEGRER